MTEFNPAEYWEGRLAKNYDISGVGFVSLGKAFNEWMYRVRKHAFLRLLDDLDLSTESSVLDVGSGTGFYVELLHRAGFSDVRGLDLTETAVNRLRETFPGVEFAKADITKLGDTPPWTNLDLITCMDVLFHVTDDSAFDEAIASISRMLRPGGLFLFSDNLPQEESRTMHHVSRSRESIVATLARHQLEVEAETPMFVLMNAPAASQHPVLVAFWKLLSTVLHGFERTGLGFLGHVPGLLLYPIERLLIRTVAPGPSTKLLVCAKV